MNTNHAPLDLLDVAETALRDLPEQVTPSPATLNCIAALATAAETQSPLSAAATSAAAGWRKAVTILLASAATTLVCFALSNTAQTGFAFDDVVKAVRQAETVFYTTVITPKPPKTGAATEVKTYHKGSATRTEHRDGSYTVIDPARQRMLSVQPGTKTASLTHLGNKSPDRPAMGNSIIHWMQTAETSGKAVGDKVIDGVRARGFEANFGPVTLTIWSNPQTKLPVAIESEIGSASDPSMSTMRDFVFNAPLDDALFSTEVPAGYTVKETQQPTIDMAAIVKLPPEEHVVRILKFYSALFDGAFPERIDGPELVSKITSGAGQKRLEDPQFMKEFTQLSGSMGAAWTFRTSLNKFGYRGAAKEGDKDTIVFWYQPEDAEKYRVVYADLTIGDAPAEKLPELPTK